MGKEKKEYKRKARRITNKQQEIVCEDKKLICSKTYRVIFGGPQIRILKMDANGQSDLS